MGEQAVMAPIRVESQEGGALWRVVFGGSKGNILDGATMEGLRDTFRRAPAERGLKAIVLEGAGSHFSFGASVEEHRPAHVARMLTTFHDTLIAAFDASVTILAAVRGQCLGGGLELAMVGHRVLAAPGARLGQPEIVLGVFAPFASVLLPERVGQASAEDLLITGRTVDAAEALRLGLVDEIAEDPTEAALAWVRTHLLPRSASSLRFAVRAARLPYRRRLESDLHEQEQLYLHELMRTEDAVEGLEAFLARRPARWVDR